MLSKILKRNRPKYHFIHIPKNGGIAVRKALAKNRDVSLSEPYHYRYVDIADEVGRDLRYFCIVRNPWSRTASRYQYAKERSVRWPADDPRRLYIQAASFKQFVKERKAFAVRSFPDMPWMGPLASWFNHLEWITNESGDVVCDCLRLERLEHDLQAYFGKKISVPRENTTKRGQNYREMYDEETIRIVADTFEKDIRYFGFDFDGPATRNIAV